MRTFIVTCSLLLAVPSLAFADSDPKTVRLWKGKCAGCHGDDGKGQTEQGKKAGLGDMSTAAWQKSMTDAKIKTAIENGVHEERGGKKKEMEGFAAKLKPEQIDALVVYVRSFGPK